MQNIVPAQFGSMLFLTPPDPPIGNNIGFTVNVPGKFIISAINFLFVTGAGVFNRNVNLYLGIGMDFWCRIHTNGFNHTATGTATYWFYDGAIYAGNLITHMVVMPFPRNIMLSGALSITTDILNIQANDQVSDIKIWGQRWLEPTD